MYFSAIGLSLKCCKVQSTKNQIFFYREKKEKKKNRKHVDLWTFKLETSIPFALSASLSLYLSRSEKKR